jgi:hypothetical protein
MLRDLRDPPRTAPKRKRFFKLRYIAYGLGGLWVLGALINAGDHALPPSAPAAAPQPASQPIVAQTTPTPAPAPKTPSRDWSWKYGADASEDQAEFCGPVTAQEVPSGGDLDNNAVAREAYVRAAKAANAETDRKMHEFFATHTALDAWSAKVRGIDAGLGNTVIATFDLAPTECHTWPNLVIAVSRDDQAAVQFLGSLKQGDFVTVAGAVQAIGWRDPSHGPAYVAVREPVITTSSGKTMKAVITYDPGILQALAIGGQRVTEHLQHLEEQIELQKLQRALDAAKLRR